MMRIQVISALLFLAVIGSTVISAQETRNSSALPDEIMINNPVYPDDEMGAVPFAHNLHIYGYGIRCFVCHHDYQEDGSNVWTEKDPVKKCVECHHPEKRQDKVRTLKGAYHGSCVTCHFGFIYRNMSNKAPYKDCEGCHQKTH